MFNILDLVDRNVFDQYTQNLTPPEINEVGKGLLNAVFEEVAQGNYVNIHRIIAQLNNSFEIDFNEPDSEIWANRSRTFYQHLAKALRDAKTYFAIHSTPKDFEVNFLRYLSGNNITVECYGNLSEEGAANFARHLQGTNVTDLKMGWNSVDDNGLFQLVQNLRNTKVRSLTLFACSSAEGLRNIIGLIPLTELTEIKHLNAATNIMTNSEALNQALAENKQRLILSRQRALAVALNAYDEIEAPSSNNLYPEGQEHTEKGTEYAMGIIGQLKNGKDGTLNPIMQNILRFLPNMNDKKATEAMTLAADRNKLSAKEEGYDPQEDNPQKRINPSHQNPSKRTRR